MPVDVQIRDRWSALFDITDAWSSLLARSSANEPTLSPLWLQTWWRVFGRADGRRLRLALMYEGGVLIGMAPVLARPAVFRGAVPLRRLELLGSGEDEADEICSDYIGLIAARGREAEVASAFVAALAAGQLGAWDELVLDLLSARAPMTAAVIDALGDAGLTPHIANRPPAPYIALPGSYNDYLAGLSSSRRYMVKRSVRDIEKFAGDALVVARADSPETFAVGWRHLVDLHGARWQADGGEGVFESARFSAFHQAVAAELLRRDQLDLMWIAKGDEPIAAIYNIVWDNKIYFYQCGRRTDLPGKLRPGIAMHAYAIGRAIESGRTVYDFLSGASRYKQQLATAETPLLTVTASRPGSAAAIAKRAVARGVDLARDVRDWLRARRADRGRERDESEPAPSDVSDE